MTESGFAAEPHLRLTFQLSITQRLTNPPEMPFFATLATLVLVLGAGSVLGCLFFGTTIAIRICCMPLAAILWVTWRVLRHPTSAFWRLVFSGRYINAIAIADQCVYFGVDDLTMVVPMLPRTSVRNGLFATYIIRFWPSAYSIVIPKNVISRESLEDALNGSRRLKA